MPACRAQVVLHTEDNVSENFCTNSWAFFNATIVDDFTAITAAFQAFYSGLVGYFPNTLAQNNHEVKFYDLPGVTPNYPVATTSFNLSTDPNQTPFPSEVAVCLSFQATKTPGSPQARRRGRVYIGPLGTNASGTDARPSSTFIDVLVQQAEDFMADITAIGDGTVWAIWSPTDQAAVNVTNGWVDNAWDTQRRRGIDYTVKTLFP